MSETPAETPAEPDAGPGHEHGQSDDPTLHQLAERVDRLTGMFERFMEGGGGQAEPEPPDIKAEVREAVREVQAKDKAKADRAAEQQSLADQVKDLKAKVETAPQEYKRATQAMGWNRP
jgi:ElaB/YqjD/DUF883 family membrane-anchored ribosome-binding protein